MLDGRYEADGDPVVLANSTIERGRWDGQPVYVKRFQARRSPTPSTVANPAGSRCAREAYVIRRLAEMPNLGPGLGRVELVEARPSDGVLVTREAPGNPLAAVLRVAPRSSQCQEAMSLAGQWLQRFQTLSADDVDRHSPSQNSPIDLVQYCGIRLERIQQAGYEWMSGDRRQAILEAVETLCRNVAAEDGLVWSHGDYAPHNILWDGRVLTPLDFAMAKLDWSLKDVTYFLHRLEMMLIYEPLRRLPIQAWTEAFLAGYGRIDASASPMFHALTIRHLLCRLNTYVCRRPLSRRQAVHNAWVRRAVRRRLLEQVARVSSRPLDARAQP